VQPHADKAPPPLNRQEALPYFGGDEQLFRDLLNQFVSYLGLGEEIARLRTLKISGDAPAFAPAAYSINGMAATFCAVRLQQAAQQLEARALENLPPTPGSSTGGGVRADA
jgi:HPt (histidine-containing phosphotransfer) domain-containing protein